MIRNLTPHPIRIIGGQVYAPDSAGPARVAVTLQPAGALGDGTPLVRATYGEIQGLPPPVTGTSLIVSRAIAAASPGRGDLLVPGDLVRDASGNVIGCRALEIAP
jgi:hypothetical protein